MADASSLKGTLLGAAIFGGIIFAAIFAVLFGITGIVIFGFSGVFGILAGAVMGLVIGADLGILFLIITTEPSSKSQKAIRTITFAGIFVGVGAFIGYSFSGGLGGMIIGGIAGAAFGFIFSLLAPETQTTVIVFIGIGLVATLAFIWWRAGAFEVFLGPLGFNLDRVTIGIQKGMRCMLDPVECFFKPFYDWSEPSVTENKKEEVQVRVDFSESKSVFFEGEDVIVKAAVVVTNPFDEEYIIEPRCVADDEEMEILPSPLIRGGVLSFGKSSIEQRASVICRKKGGLRILQENSIGEEVTGDIKKEVESHDFELRLLRDIVTKTEWNIYTMHEDALALKEDPFSGIQENLRGRTVLSKMKYESPLKVSIGSDNDQPLFEGSWPFSVVLREQDINGNITSIKSLTLEDPKSKTVRFTQPCELDEGFDSYSLSSSKLDTATRILRLKDVPIDIQCTLQIGGLDPSRLAPEKSVVRASAEFQFESVYELPLTVLEESEREKVTG